jgi:hypothetical protein
MAVKRVEPYFDIRLPPVRLDLDDLKQIRDQLGDQTDITFRHADYIYDSLEELTNHVSRRWIPSLVIRARVKNRSYSDIAIEFERNGTQVRADPGSTEKAAAVAHYLTSKVRWYSWQPTGSWWYIIRGGLAAVLAIAVVVALPDLIPGSRIVRGLAPALGAVLFLIVMSPDRLWLCGTRIGLYSAARQPNFWERNRDRLLVDALISLLSAFLGFLLGRIAR